MNVLLPQDGELGYSLSQSHTLYGGTKDMQAVVRSCRGSPRAHAWIVGVTHGFLPSG